MTIQAALADHHGDLRAVALAEANVAASIAYVVLIGLVLLGLGLGTFSRGLKIPRLERRAGLEGLCADAAPGTGLRRSAVPGLSK